MVRAPRAVIAPTTGYYTVGGFVIFQAGASSCYIELRQMGGAIAAHQAQAANFLTINTITTLTAGEYVELYVSMTSVLNANYAAFWIGKL